MTEIIKISTKGQIVLPIKMRENLGMKEGDIIAVETINNMMVLKRIDVDLLTQFKQGLSDLKKGKIKKVA